MSPKDEILTALRQKIGFDPVTVSDDTNPNVLRITGRIQNAVLQQWFAVQRYVETAEASAPWSVDFSKKYFKYGPDETRFTWRIILQGENLPQYLPTIAQLILQAPAAAVAQRVNGPIMEIALGGDPNRHSTAGGKRGAGPAGSIAVGPGAAQIKNMGG